MSNGPRVHRWPVIRLHINAVLQNNWNYDTKQFAGVLPFCVVYLSVFADSCRYSFQHCHAEEAVRRLLLCRRNNVYLKYFPFNQGLSHYAAHVEFQASHVAPSICNCVSAKLDGVEKQHGRSNIPYWCTKSLKYDQKAVKATANC